MLREQATEEARLVTALVEAVRLDGTGDFRDDVLQDLLAAVQVPGRPYARLKTVAILVSLARRIELSTEDYPNLIRAAAELAADYEGGEKERALHVSRTIIRPHADAHLKEV